MFVADQDGVVGDDDEEVVDSGEADGHAFCAVMNRTVGCFDHHVIADQRVPTDVGIHVSSDGIPRTDVIPLESRLNH